MTLRKSVQTLEILQHRIFGNWPVCKNVRQYTIQDILFLQKIEELYRLDYSTN